MNNDHIYWLFSSTAQTISAFIAFLLAGFALVHSMMDSIQKNDPSLEEIYYELKRKQYRTVKWLSILTGMAIILSLATVYINGIRSSILNDMVTVSSVASLASIILGIYFVITIINPDIYTITAKDMYKKETEKKASGLASIPNQHFFVEFVELEKAVRNKFEANIPKLVGNFPIDRTISFRSMVNALYRSNIIDQSLNDALMEVSKYRNLIFHGHLENVHEGILNTVKKLRSEIQDL